MMYKNAGIKSKKEAVQRLINGEEFVITSGNSIVTRFKFCENEVNPLQGSDGGWLHYCEEWETEVEWYDNLGEGILCWVWDFDEKSKQIAIVTEYHKHNQYPYIATCGWGNAVPVKPGEIDKFVSKHG